ncbi:hypothetical protein E2320_007050, partial [Naja naja]
MPTLVLALIEAAAHNPLTPECCFGGNGLFIAAFEGRPVWNCSKGKLLERAELSMLSASLFCAASFHFKCSQLGTKKPLNIEAHHFLVMLPTISSLNKNQQSDFIRFSSGSKLKWQNVGEDA